MFSRYKFIRQENIKDCGVTCLLNFIRMYGGNNAIERLRTLTKTNKNGTSAYNLMEAAKQLGFEANGYKCRNLDITVPCIAHVILKKSYHHYVIILKILPDKNIIIVNDPLVGTKKYSITEFYNIWTKVIIVLKPISEIANINPNKEILKLLYSLIKPHKKTLLIIFTLSILVIIFSIINTFYLKAIVDNLDFSKQYLTNLFIFFIIVIILKTSSDYLRNRLLIYINRNIDQTLMYKTYKHIISLPYNYYNSRQTGDIIARINDLSYIKELISRISVTLLVDFILVILALFMLYFINNILFVVAITIIFFYLIIVFIYNPILRKYIIINQEKQADVTSYLVETISGINTIKGLNIEDKVINRTNNKYDDLLENNCQFDRVYNHQRTLKDVVIYGGFNVVLFIGSTLILENKLTLSNLILFNSLLLYFLEPIKSIFDLELLIKRALSSLRRIKELYDIPLETSEGIKNTINGNISFNNLSFAYDDVNNILKGINLTINQGEKVLFIGNSGSGKSTLVKLLLRYYKIQKDSIILDNNDINRYSIEAIKENICYVSQQETIFTDSIYNNIVLNRNISKKDFNKILKITNINDILKQKRINNNFLLEENGCNISGGERQRIIIARSLLKKANIYIFDESMNEITINLERRMLNNIFNNFKNKTIIVISHRLNNKDLYDKIITIENKKIKDIIIKERS